MSISSFFDYLIFMLNNLAPQVLSLIRNKFKQLERCSFYPWLPTGLNSQFGT